MPTGDNYEGKRSAAISAADPRCSEREIAAEKNALGEGDSRSAMETQRAMMSISSNGSSNQASSRAKLNVATGEYEVGWNGLDHLVATVILPAHFENADTTKQLQQNHSARVCAQIRYGISPPGKHNITSNLYTSMSSQYF